MIRHSAHIAFLRSQGSWESWVWCPWLWWPSRRSLQLGVSAEACVSCYQGCWNMFALVNSELQTAQHKLPTEGNFHQVHLTGARWHWEHLRRSTCCESEEFIPRPRSFSSDFQPLGQLHTYFSEKASCGRNFSRSRSFMLFPSFSSICISNYQLWIDSMHYFRQISDALWGWLDFRHFTPACLAVLFGQIWQTKSSASS